jgi:putative heme-binding domain-containing protein
LDGVGNDIGPNLDSVRAHPPEKLLTSILDPSREVEPRYLAYTCRLTNGEELYGLIASETGNGLELKVSDGTSRTVLRSDIESLQGAQLSLMPEGLETALSPQDIADLIYYLRNRTY